MTTTNKSTITGEINSSNQFLKPVIVLFKRIIRRLTCWLIEPALQQQTDFNNAAVSAVMYNTEVVRELIKIIIRQYEIIDKLSKQQAELNEENIVDGVKINKQNNAEDSKRIAFFTPLPPIKSGISDYSVDIVNELSQYSNIDVYIEDGYEPLCDLSKNVNVYNHTEFENRKHIYSDIIYQVGNSKYHIYMFSYIKEHKGIVVLHDYNLHNAAHYMTITLKNNIYDYFNYFLEDYPEDKAYELIENYLYNKASVITFQTVINGFVVNYAKKIIVHSDDLRERLLKKNARFDVQTIRHYAKEAAIEDKAKVRRKYRISESDVIFASFGFLAESKRVEPLLRAFKRICENSDNIRFYFVGECDNKDCETKYKEIIEILKLTDKITITDYTDCEVYNNYLDIADVCFNLRYPYNGETSGSLMRALAKGKCAVVNDIGSFSEIPDECCIKIRDVGEMTTEEETETIYEIMKMLMFDANKRNETGKSARDYANKVLDLRVIAKQYFDYIFRDS